MSFAPHTALPFAPLALLSRVVDVAVVWNDARQTRASLSRLSARELDDIGLCRGDIDHVAATGRRPSR